MDIRYFIFAFAFFALQLILCFTAKKTAVRLIPVYVIVVGYAVALLFLAGIIHIDGGFIDGDALGAAVVAIASSVTAVCVAIAWGVYLIVRKRRKNK